MTPSDLTSAPELAIRKGARWAYTFTYTVTDTGSVVDLTSYLPFVMTFKHPTQDTIYFNATIDSSSASIGILRASLTAAQTDTMHLGKVRVGMRDAANNPWADGILPVKYFTPEPA